MRNKNDVTLTESIRRPLPTSTGGIAVERVLSLELKPRPTPKFTHASWRIRRLSWLPLQIPPIPQLSEVIVPH
jgi:hypothetical protein